MLVQPVVPLEMLATCSCGGTCMKCWCVCSTGRDRQRGLREEEVEEEERERERERLRERKRERIVRDLVVKSIMIST